MNMNNMYQGGFYNPQMAPGMVPNQNAAMPKTGNWLSAEDYALLQKGLSQFKLSVTKEELAKGQCNHYYINGTSALVPDQDGSGGCTCAICGTHFNSREYDQKEIENATQNILDILNTIKIMYLSIDPSAALEYFQIIPFIEKIPQLYNIAVTDFKKYEGVDNFIPANQQNPFNVFGMMVGGASPFMGQPMYQQPMMPQAPMYNGFAQQNPGFGAAPGYNPLYGQPQAPGYVPQTQGYAMNPMGAAMVNTNMPVQPQAPQAAPAPAAAGTEVKVDTQFKK